MPDRPHLPTRAWPALPVLPHRNKRAPQAELTAGSEQDLPRSAVVRCAVYCQGDRVASPEGLSETYHALHEQAIAWIGLYQPSQSELSSLAEEFDLHELAVEDAVVAHQRPKLERYGGTLFAVLRPAWYVDATEEVHFAELHVFLGHDFIITVRHGEQPDLGAVRRRMEDRPDLLQLGPEAVLYAILDRVVDDYFPVVAGLSNDIDEIETQVFNREAGVSRRIYELNREVIEFLRATRPLEAVMSALREGFAKYGTDQELQSYLRDVQDHLTQVIERAEEFRQLLRDILTVNATLVAQEENEEMKAMTEAGLRQNDDMRRISAWVAVAAVPTAVTGFFGQNLPYPGFGKEGGFITSCAVIVLGSGLLYVLFKFKKWL
jgi:magnesium transporter